MSCVHYVMSSLTEYKSEHETTRHTPFRDHVYSMILLVKMESIGLLKYVGILNGMILKKKLTLIFYFSVVKLMIKDYFVCFYFLYLCYGKCGLSNLA